MKVIEVTISPTGQSNVQTRGFTGSACRAASRFLEAALGSRTSETLAAEFHQTQAVQESKCGTVFFPPKN